jgi:hypothetical protein
VGLLHGDEIARYRGLWAALEPLAKHGRRSNKALCRADAEKLVATLETWYFHTGGLYLSVDARNAYDALLTALTAVTAQGWGTDPNRNPQAVHAPRGRGADPRGQGRGTLHLERARRVTRSQLPSLAATIAAACRGVTDAHAQQETTEHNLGPWLWTLTAEIDGVDCDFILEEESGDADPGDPPGPDARLASGGATSPQRPHHM